LYYEQQSLHSEKTDPFVQKDNPGTGEKIELELHQCKYCGTVYDMEVGEPDNNIQSGTPFSSLPETYLCPLCESGKDEFILVPRSDALSSGFITSH
jgi:rubredoxin